MNDRAMEIGELMDDAEAIVANAMEEVEAPKHTLLESWRELLKVIELAMAERPQIGYCSQVMAKHPQIKVCQVERYHRDYHERLLALRAVLLDEIESDPECLKRLDDDAEGNRHHYLNLLVNWQKLVYQWENEWDCTANDANITMASIPDAARFVLGSQGMVGHLGAIGFRITEEDAALIQAAVIE